VRCQTYGYLPSCRASPPKLHCLVTATTCPDYYTASPWPEFEPTTFWLQVWRPTTVVLDVWSAPATLLKVKCHWNQCILNAAQTAVPITAINTWLLLHYICSTWVSRYQKDETSLDLNDARDDGVLWWQWHQLDHMQTICTSVQTDNHTNTSSLIFYRPDALPDAQPTVWKHWRHSDKHLNQWIIKSNTKQ